MATISLAVSVGPYALGTQTNRYLRHRGPIVTFNSRAASKAFAKSALQDCSRFPIDALHRGLVAQGLVAQGLGAESVRTDVSQTDLLGHAQGIQLYVETDDRLGTIRFQTRQTGS